MTRIGKALCSPITMVFCVYGKRLVKQGRIAVQP